MVDFVAHGVYRVVEGNGISKMMAEDDEGASCWWWEVEKKSGRSDEERRGCGSRNLRFVGFTVGSIGSVKLFSVHNLIKIPL